MSKLPTNFFALSTGNVTEAEAELIADAYYRSGKDPLEMRRLLEVDTFDLNILTHPVVKAKIVEKKIEVTKLYTLHDHVEYLKKIRDHAFNDDNYKIALSSEIQIGKAAGLYDPKPIEDPLLGNNAADATKLSTDELRRRLAAMQRMALAPPPKEDGEEFTDDSGEI